MRGGKVRATNICVECNQAFQSYGDLRTHKLACNVKVKELATLVEGQPIEVVGFVEVVQVVETKEFILSTWGALNSKCVILPSDANFSFLHHFIIDPHDTILALDFDQTITIKPEVETGDINSHLRGGAKSREAFQKLYEAGVAMMIITAQTPSEVAVRNLKFELDKLNIAEYFGLENWSKQPVLDLLKSWGANTTLSFSQLERKLSALLVLNTPRYGKDLARFCGAKRITIKEDNSEVTFFLQSCEEPTPLQWSGKQTVKIKKRMEEVSEKDREKYENEQLYYYDEDLCLILTWREYLSRTHNKRSLTEDGIDIPERLFIRFSEPLEVPEIGVPLTFVETIQLVKSVFQEAGISAKHIESVCENPCKLIQSQATGAQLFSYGNTYCSKYNKAEAMEMFLVGNKQARGRKTVIFVDDNSDNAWNIFEFFAAKELAGSKTMKVTSCWFTPPLKAENAEPSLLNRLKVLHESHSLPITFL